jgi:polar amino acid transport system substrate-binding protein
MKITLRTILISLGLFQTMSFGLIAADAPPPLRVGVAPVSPPMVFKEGGKIVGLEADFAQALGRDLGREVKFVELPWEDLIDALISDKIDIIMSSMSVTRGRQFRIAFSDPYLRIGQIPLIRAEEQRRYGFVTDGFAGRTIGVRKATTGDLLAQQEFPRAKRKYYKSDEEAAKALSKKKIDLFIDDSSMIWYLAGKYEAEGLTVAPLVFSDELLAWGMRRTDASLQQAVSAFLKKAQASGEVNRVIHQWIPKFQ